MMGGENNGFFVMRYEIHPEEFAYPKDNQSLFHYI